MCPQVPPVSRRWCRTRVFPWRAAWWLVGGYETELRLSFIVTSTSFSFWLFPVTFDVVASSVRQKLLRDSVKEMRRHYYCRVSLRLLIAFISIIKKFYKLIQGIRLISTFILTWGTFYFPLKFHSSMNYSSNVLCFSFSLQHILQTPRQVCTVFRWQLTG